MFFFHMLCNRNCFAVAIHSHKLDICLAHNLFGTVIHAISSSLHTNSARCSSEAHQAAIDFNDLAWANWFKKFNFVHRYGHHPGSIRKLASKGNRGLVEPRQHHSTKKITVIATITFFAHMC